jgi:hypothetical protein
LVGLRGNPDEIGYAPMKFTPDFIGQAFNGANISLDRLDFCETSVDFHYR